MAKLLDRILVIDVESTCWEGAPPPDQSSDIIEIGLAVIDAATRERLEKRSILVKPARSEVSAFCTQLTTITPEMAAGGVSFREACKILKDEYQAKERLWASWGDYDRRQFERCCTEQQVGYPFGPGHLNVKSLFAIAERMDREVGLDGAYAKLGWTLEGTHHRGHDDAWNIAGVLSWLLRRMS